MRVGIVTPMWGEARCFTAPGAARARLSEIGEDVLVCVSGIGSERAARGARELLEHGAGALVSAGVAGGLDPRLSPGDLVIADRVIPPDGAVIATHAAWREELARRVSSELACTIAPIVESARVLASPAQKEACFRATGAAVVDMESAAIAAEARRARVPFLVLRAVCDPSSMCIPRAALAASDPQGKPRPAVFLVELCRRPREIVDIVRLQRAFHRAEEALRAAVRIAGPRLCADELALERSADPRARS